MNRYAVAPKSAIVSAQLAVASPPTTEIERSSWVVDRTREGIKSASIVSGGRGRGGVGGGRCRRETMGGRGVALGGGWLFGEEKVARRFVTDRAHLFLRRRSSCFAATTDRRCGASVSGSRRPPSCRRKSSAFFVLDRLFIFRRRKFRSPSDLMREIWLHLTGGAAAGRDQPLGGENLLPPLASCSRRASLFHVNGGADQRAPPPRTRPPIPPPAYTRARSHWDYRA